MFILSFKEAYKASSIRIAAGNRIGPLDVPVEHRYLLIAACYIALCIAVQAQLTPPAIPVDNSYLLDGLA